MLHTKDFHRSTKIDGQKSRRLKENRLYEQSGVEAMDLRTPPFFKG
jgi:hypothetical protein